MKITQILPQPPAPTYTIEGLTRDDVFYLAWATGRHSGSEATEAGYDSKRTYDVYQLLNGALK